MQLAWLAEKNVFKTIIIFQRNTRKLLSYVSNRQLIKFHEATIFLNIFK